MMERLCVDGLHTGVSTENDELIILFDCEQMHIYDMRGVELDSKVKGYPVTEI